MFEAVLSHPADVDGWRRAARAALAAGLDPESVRWRIQDEPSGLFADEPVPKETETASAPPVNVSQAFLSLAEQVVRHSNVGRFALLYRLLWRIAHGEKTVLQVLTDRDVAAAQALAQAVQRDEHKMKAFLRFRRIERAEPEHFAAWFEPDHHIVEAVAPFFRRRFSGMRWTILTPRRTADWDGAALRFGPGASAASAPRDDALDALWRTYYANIFNPARLNVSAMRAEMPERYWKNLPEARLIAPLVAGARKRTAAMVAAEPVPHSRADKWRPRTQAKTPALPLQSDAVNVIRQGLRACIRCPLHRSATQAVMGEGPPDARIMIIGEQPGDQEDLTGRPFVGPAGEVLDKALAAAGLARPAIYFTNAVKHFKFEPRGKRRIHKKPAATEVTACSGWLRNELDAIKPSVVVALGATAAGALLGRTAPMRGLRGRALQLGGSRLMVSWHPAYLLRLDDAALRTQAEGELVADLRQAQALLAEAQAA